MIETTLFSSQSYWDWLPREIQHYIHSLSTWQTILDLHKSPPWRLLLKEILDYHKLKDEWGLGHIECTLLPCNDPGCPGKVGLINKHMGVTGYYTNFVENETYAEFLGYSLKEAHDRLPHVKSNLVLQWGSLIELTPPVETS